MTKTNWHALKISDIIKKVEGDRKGLTIKVAEKRLLEQGPNILPEDKRPSMAVIFWRQMKSPLVYVLLFAVIVTGILKEFIDMGVILAAVILNASIGFWQELKADEAFAVLKEVIKHNTYVLRDGYTIKISASKVVEGDIMVLSAGDKIPADGRLLEIYDFEANEATLTGESMPVQKQIKSLKPSMGLTERNNMVFQGTTVARGKAIAIVVATGKRTAFGEIAMLVHKVKDQVTPLQSQFGKLAKVLGIVVVLITVGIFALGIMQGRSVSEMFLTSVAVAVAAIPEGLVVSLTVILAIGMKSLAKSKAVAKRLLAAETLGSVSVICSDKTGTLTTGEMEVAEIIVWGNKGPASVSSKDKNPTMETVKALEIAVIGNEAVISNPEDSLKKWEVFGDPTPRALLLAGIHAGLNPLNLAKKFPKLDEIPFDTEHKWAATLHKCKDSKDNILNVRGAPERLLSASKSFLVGTSVKKFTNIQKQAFIKQLEKMTLLGERVVAVAYSKLPNDFVALEKMNKGGSPPGDLIFVGLFGIKDPLREGIAQTIESAKQAGIKTVMITGDHINTAIAIGKELGLVNKNSIAMTGDQIDKMDDDMFQKEVARITIFARVLPKHKVRIIQAFHALGETVAMTGDGVNDAPALKTADIGVAVGTGTDVAKEAADIVLTDNNFKTIVNAVRGGRNIYENIRKVVAYLLSGSWSEIIVIGGSLVLGLPLPLFVGQILWVNLMEDSLPNMALAFDPGEPDIMSEKPRDRHARMIDGELKTLIFGVGITTSILLFALYWYLLKTGYDLTYIRTMIFIGLGTDSLLYIYSIRSLRRFIWKVNPFNNKFLLFTTLFGIIMMAGAVYVPFLQTILKTVPIRAVDWLLPLGLSVLTVLLIELVKGVFTVRAHKRK